VPDLPDLPSGLFRKPEAVAKSKKRRRKPVSAAVDDAVILGSLADLRAASKGGMDPSGGELDGVCIWCLSYTGMPCSANPVLPSGCLCTCRCFTVFVVHLQGKVPRWWLPM
jgi:hypothetical protein